MSQINVNEPPRDTYDTGGDRSAAAGINLITVLIVLAVLAVLAWFLFTGPLRGIGSTTSPATTTNNPPAQTQPSNNVNVNPPNITVNPPASGSNGGTGGNTSTGGATR